MGKTSNGVWESETDSDNRVFDGYTNVVIPSITGVIFFCRACLCSTLSSCLFEYQANLQRLMCLSGKLVTRVRECQLWSGFLQRVSVAVLAVQWSMHQGGRRLSECLTQALADWAEAAGSRQQAGLSLC